MCDAETNAARPLMVIGVELVYEFPEGKLRCGK